jgi:hypothetical protein
MQMEHLLQLLQTPLQQQLSQQHHLHQLQLLELIRIQFSGQRQAMVDQ